MNGKNEPPAHRAEEPEPIRQTDRLNQIERRLKQAKPHPPKLDLAALEQMADSVLAGSECAQPESPTTVRLREDRWRGPSRSLAIIASAWACGAIAGSLATMFIMMSRIESNGGLNGPAFQNEDRLSPPTVRREVSPAVAPAVERQDSLPRRDATQPDKDAPVLAMLVDPSGGGYGRYGMGSSTLRAGMHLVKDMRAPSDILPPATSPAKQAPPGDGSPQAKASKKPESPPTASPEITRESILDDLLREMSGAVL